LRVRFRLRRASLSLTNRNLMKIKVIQTSKMMMKERNISKERKMLTLFRVVKTNLLGFYDILKYLLI